jgi:ferredoxin
MIYYFSATGNSAWVAKELAAGTGDRAVSMDELIKQGELPPPVKPGETLGIVFPVYAFAPPRLVTDFVRKLEVGQGAFVYGVCTMADFAGDSFRLLRKILRVDSCYSIRMPSNYIVMSGREPEAKMQKKLAAAKARLPEICASVRAKKVEFSVRRGPGAFLFSALAARLFDKFVSDQAFRADDACISCGLCARLCPLDNIKLEDGRPVWHGNCMQCMACIQHCPTRAINYGGKTKNRTRYVFDDLSGQS